MKVFVTKEFTFDSAHYLPRYEGKCHNMHGHTYRLQVTVSGDVEFPQEYVESATDFMVIDFGTLSSLVKSVVIDRLDHGVLNDHFACPTAEYMAMSILHDMSVALPKDVKVESVKLWETPTSFAEARAEE